ncbi:MAG: molybdopterin molybdotransferase MoeA [Burkholderiaceae bacterium]|nr:molybdopterin molybdotransferase MoeA [Burkholderiaceae bacterium]
MPSPDSIDRPRPTSNTGFSTDAMPVAAAIARMCDGLQPVAAIERVAIRAALSRVLAQDVLSPIDVPAHDNSAMDGFAVRGVDLSPQGTTRLEVVGTALAGEPGGRRIEAGQAMRIMTGAVMPDGADTVIVQEVARMEAGHVILPDGQQTGQNRRLRGEDLSRDMPALTAGKILTPADLGLLASIGVAEVPVRRRLRVAFFSTGNELRSIGETLAPGQIYDSNRYTIYGMLTAMGADLIDMGVIPDQPQALEAAMRAASESADAVISSGGVSVGEADFTKQVMNRLGDVDFWTIAMRPGRPMAFGRVGPAYYFGLPGNPVAVMITFYFLAREALLELSGARRQRPAYVSARADQPIRKRPGRSEYQRGVLGHDDAGRPVVSITGTQGSGVLSSMSTSNCIVVLHHDQGSVAAGEPVDCLPFEGLL